jgi:hypothetical protein
MSRHALIWGIILSLAFWAILIAVALVVRGAR